MDWAAESQGQWIGLQRARSMDWAHFQTDALVIERNLSGFSVSAILRKIGVIKTRKLDSEKNQSQSQYRKITLYV